MQLSGSFSPAAVAVAPMNIHAIRPVEVHPETFIRTEDGRLGNVKAWSTEKSEWVCIVSNAKGNGTELITISQAEALEGAERAAPGMGAIASGPDAHHCFRMKLFPWTNEMQERLRLVAYAREYTCRFAMRFNELDAPKDELEVFFCFRVKKTLEDVNNEVMTGPWEVSDFSKDWADVNRNFQEVSWIQAKTEDFW